MAEENNTEEVETEEKTLEDQLAALEEVAASFEDEAETKADVSSYASEDSEGGEEEAAEEEAAEEEDSEEEDSEEEAVEEEAAEEEGVEAKSEEEDMEEKVAAAVEEVLAEGEEADEKAATLTGFPHDRVVLDDEDQEDDSEELMKPPGGIEDAKEHGGKKRRVVVVEMDPDDITDDMKAYVVEVDDDEKAMGEEEPVATVPVASAGAPPELAEEEAEEEEEDEDDDMKGWGKKPGKNRLARLMALANGDDDEDEDEKEEVPNLPTAVLVGKEDEVPENGIYGLLDQDALNNRLERLGTEAKSLNSDSFLCSIERSVRTGDVCNFCRGGCAQEKGLPGLLEIEVMAEQEFKGEVVDSGYAPKDDIFVLDIKTDEGYIESYYAGNGSPLGWIRLENDVEEKTAEEVEGTTIISFQEAEQVALKNIEGKSLGVDVDIFEGADAYVVEIDGTDGKSYDAYVGVDGQFLGSDMIDLSDDEEAEIKELIAEKDALEAEVKLKRIYSGEQLKDLIADGLAMEDGMYPIVVVDDLSTAITASARTKSQEVRDHITKRANELESTELIPEEWDEVKAAEVAEFEASLMELQMMEVETDNTDTE